MEIKRPGAKLPTPAELQDLEKLKALIERAIADGKLTGDEMAMIRAAMWADRVVSPEELELVRTLISEKIRSGELEWVF